MKRYLPLLFISSFLSIFGNAAKTPVVAIYNVDSVLIVMPEYVAALHEYNEFDSLIERQDSIIEAEYRLKIIEYGADSTKLSPLIRELRKKELVDFNERILQFRQQISIELEKKKKALREPLEKKIAATAADIGKEKGFLAVISSRGYVRRISYLDDWPVLQTEPDSSLLSYDISQPEVYTDQKITNANITAVLIEKLKQS